MWECEDDVVKHVLQALAPHWEADRVENDHGNPGFPDLVYTLPNFGSGFIEFKFVPSLQHENEMRVGLKREQRDFLVRHGEAGGNCHILLGARRGRTATQAMVSQNEMWLFGWEVASDLLELHRPRQFLTYGERVIGPKHLLELLRQ
jgi:hypothetical protein